MDDTVLREHLGNLLKGHGAHLDIETAISDFPSSLSASKIPGVPHTPWRLIEHMRITQWDILEFCRNPGHVSPKFPDGYWPTGDAPDGDTEWTTAVKSFLADLEAMQEYVSDPNTDLFTPIAHGDGQTVLREALIVADHNSYHLGQLMLIRGAFGRL